MKTTKWTMTRWLIACLLVLACCFVLGACAETDTDLPVETGSDTEATTTEAAPTYLNLTIDGVDIGEYDIVYAHSPMENKISSTGKTIGVDLGAYLLGEEIGYDFDYQTAVRLQTLIKEATGKTLDLVKDTVGVKTDYEILVGATNRAETETLKDTLAFDKFLCKMEGTRYLICGKDYGTTWHAVDEWEETLTKAVTDGESSLDMKTVGDLSGEYAMKKVACVGDSITRGSQAVYAQGADVTSWGSAKVRDIYYEEYLAYPCVAQRNLWQDYLFYNFGASGASMSLGGTLYQKTAKYELCMEYSAREDFAYDLVLIMLGSNDANGASPKNDGTLIDSQLTSYINATKKLMNDILVGSPNAKFVMMNVPHRCDGENPRATDAAVRWAQNETVYELLGEGFPVWSFDMNRFTIENLTADPTKEGTDELKLHEDYYNIKEGANDTTHLNNKGYYLVGMEMIKVVEYILDEGDGSDYLS